jgi:hypothetical protein
MCQYIKDNGEQCGIDTDPFCRHHDDTEQAEEWREGGPITEGADSRAVTFLDQDDPSICNDCEAPVRRTVAAVGEATYQPKMVTVEERFVCNCGDGGWTIRAQNVPKNKVPNGWYESS